jgi:hypothetical protein
MFVLSRFLGLLLTGKHVYAPQGLRRGHQVSHEAFGNCSRIIRQGKNFLLNWREYIFVTIVSLLPV